MYKYFIFEALYLLGGGIQLLPKAAAGCWLSHYVSILDDSIFFKCPCIYLKVSSLLTKLLLNKHENVS